MEGAILALTDIDALLRSQENRQSLETSLRSLLGSRRICCCPSRRRDSPCSWADRS